MSYKISYGTVFYVYEEDGEWVSEEINRFEESSSSCFGAEAGSDFESYLWSIPFVEILERENIKIETGYYHYWGILTVDWWTSSTMDGTEQECEVTPDNEIIYKLTEKQCKEFGLD